MKKRLIIICLTVAAVLCVGGIFLCYTVKANNNFFAMDTYISVNVKGIGASKTAEEIQKKIEDLDKNVLSRQSENSAVAVLNKNHGGKADENLINYVNILLDISVKTAGKFDFTLGEVSDLWGFTSSKTIPDDKALAKALENSGAEKVTVKGDTISFPDGVVIDLGAAGKGIALDETRKILESSSAKEAVVSVGGSILFYGDRQFTVGIDNPEDSSDIVAVLTVDACCVSTSGDYERYFEVDGKRYHHILDPGTGYPTDNGLTSVTIVSDSGILSDALSTACFVLGVEKGMALAKEYGCEAVFIDKDKNIWVTDGLASSIEVKADGYKIKK